MSNLEKSSSRFSSRRFAIAIVLMVSFAGAAQAEGRKSATGICAPFTRAIEILDQASSYFCLLAGCDEESDPHDNYEIPVENSEIDTEIEVDPPTPTIP